MTSTTSITDEEDEEDYLERVVLPSRISKTKEEYISRTKRKQSGGGGGGKRGSRVDAGSFWANYYKSRRKVVHHPHNHLNSKESSGPANSSTTITSEISDAESDTPLQLNVVDSLERTDWEHWWVKSPDWRRFDVLALILIFLMGVVQLAASIYFFMTYSSGKAADIDPFICRTPNCDRLGKRLKGSINEHVSPCDDFYQFVCGNYIDDHDTGEFDGIHDKAWDMDHARIEFGKQNVLAAILRSYNGNRIHDQPIRFYQVCRDPRYRDEGIIGVEFDSFKVLITKLFGNLRDLNNDALSPSLEEMALRMTKSIGDFGFFKFDLAGYPYILIQNSDFPWEKQFTSTTIKMVLQVIFPEPELTADDLNLLSNGAAEVLARMTKLMESDKTKLINCCKQEAPQPQETTCTKGPLDIKKVLEDYVEKEPRNEYSSPNIEAYAYALQNCWEQEQFNPNDHKVINNIATKKHAIVGFWILRIVMWSLKEIDLDAFILLQPALNNTAHFQDIAAWRSKSIDFQCFQSLTRSLGYLPVHRYFERLGVNIGLDADQYYRNVETFLRRRILNLAKFWANATLLPHIDSASREEGMKLLTNYDPFNLMSNIPTQQDLSVENSEIFGDLHLGNEHVQNVFNGKEFTLGRAKHWWNRKHDPLHVLLWNSNTFKLEDPYYNVKPVIENENSLFTPISFYLEPFDMDILSVRNAGSGLVSVRAVLNMLLDYIDEDHVKRRLKDENWTPSGDASEKECWLQMYDKTSRTVIMHTTTMKNLHTYQNPAGVFLYKQTFGNVIALKVLHSDSEEREYITTTPFWALGKKFRRWVMSKKLKGFEWYNEEQIFFMAAVRNFCRQKPENDTQGFYMEYITSINAALQQMHEFATAWKCPPLAAMNPPYKCF